MKHVKQAHLPAGAYAKDFGDVLDRSIINKTLRNPKQKTTATIIRSEDDECIALVGLLNLLQRQERIIAYSHVPNETYSRSWAAGRRRKAIGVMSGFPDYIIIGHGVFIFLEMKREKGGTVSPSQKYWIDLLGRQPNTFAKVCYGFVDAQSYLRSMV